MIAPIIKLILRFEKRDWIKSNTDERDIIMKRVKATWDTLEDVRQNVFVYKNLVSFKLQH